MNAAFNTIRAQLVGYAKNYNVSANTDDMFSLDEELPHSRTQFAFVHPSRSGARLGFYPLHVFPELAAGLPTSLATKLKSKSVMTFATVNADDQRTLSDMFASGHRRIMAQRALAPDRAYCRKIDLAATTTIITKLPRAAGVVVTARKADVAVTLAPTMKVPPVLAARQKKPGTLTFKTITPAEHEALATLIT